VVDVPRGGMGRAVVFIPSVVAEVAVGSVFVRRVVVVVYTGFVNRVVVCERDIVQVFWLNAVERLIFEKGTGVWRQGMP
jgi:hypothetical protein